VHLNTIIRGVGKTVTVLIATKVSLAARKEESTKVVEPFVVAVRGMW
jgi:hypothetical protein